MQVDPARRAAHDLFVEVREDGAYANLVWPAILAHRGVTGRDAAFATELAYGAMRWRGRHDAVLAACIDRPITDVQPELLDALRLGVHQLHNMRVGAHAAVSETVNLIRAVISHGAAGFGNAVLRKVAAGGDAAAWLDHLQGCGALPTLVQDPGAHLSVASSHPGWVVRALHESLAASTGVADWAATAALLDADNTAAGVTLAARSIPVAELAAHLAERGVPFEPGRWSRRALRVGSGNPADIAEVATGAAGVQDEGSQVVALALADAPIEGPDARWLDMCAGPGGKAALLADLVAARRGSLTAVELHQHRARLVGSALRPIAGIHRVICADALVAEIGSGYDRILVDAPCTGLGALRRRPESRWRRTPAEVPELVALQGALLRRAVDLLRPGGVVLYATCSPHVAETHGVVAEVLAQGRVEVQPLVGPAGSADGSYLRMWPHVHDNDGMFAALLRRPAD